MTRVREAHSLFGQGLSRAQIAAQMGIAVNAAAVYLWRAGVRFRPERLPQPRRVRFMCEDCIANKHKACKGRCACICWRDRDLRRELHRENP